MSPDGAAHETTSCTRGSAVAEGERCSRRHDYARLLKVEETDTHPAGRVDIPRDLASVHERLPDRNLSSRRRGKGRVCFAPFLAKVDEPAPAIGRI